ncbi:hypothetical protein HPSSW140_1150 [Glaesserella parasuis SW140]|nr:hypothetical protein HPSSW140_1150 [Glaesserella parasuis SW140]
MTQLRIIQPCWGWGLEKRATEWLTQPKADRNHVRLAVRGLQVGI